MSPRPYADRTEVPVDRSRAEIERLLTKHGATSFASGWTKAGATLLFEAHARRIRFELPLPSGTDTRADRERRRLWRCLCLVIKAKLEAVASGLVTFEEEFLAHVVLPSGETVGMWAGPQLLAAYERGAGMPPMLGPAPG